MSRAWLSWSVMKVDGEIEVEVENVNMMIMISEIGRAHV